MGQIFCPKGELIDNNEFPFRQSENSHTLITTSYILFIQKNFYYMLKDAIFLLFFSGHLFDEFYCYVEI